MHVPAPFFVHAVLPTTAQHQRHRVNTYRFSAPVSSKGPVCVNRGQQRLGRVSKQPSTRRQHCEVVIIITHGSQLPARSFTGGQPIRNILCQLEMKAVAARANQITLLMFVLLINSPICVPRQSHGTRLP